MGDRSLALSRLAVREVRAREISAATGVPQDFEVLWKVRVIDCYRAERLIHQHLDRYRPSKNREFFALPVDEAVGVLNRVADEVGRVQKADDAKLVVDDQAQSGPSRPLPEITVVSPKQQRKKSGNARRTAVTFDDHASYTDAPTRPILGELRRRVLALDKHLQDGEVCTPNHRIAYNVPGHKIFLEVKVQRAAIVLHLIEGNLPDPAGITSPIPASHGWGDLKKRIKLSPGGIKLDAGWPFVEAAYRARMTNPP